MTACAPAAGAQNLHDVTGERYSRMRDHVGRRHRGNFLPVVEDLAPRRVQELGQQVETRRLAGSVRADQRMHGNFSIDCRRLSGVFERKVRTSRLQRLGNVKEARCWRAFLTLRKEIL